MKEYTIAELPPELLLIGTEEDREKFLPAIIGIAKDKSRLAYSWDLLVECFMEAWGSRMGTSSRARRLQRTRFFVFPGTTRPGPPGTDKAHRQEQGIRSSTSKK